MAIFRMAFSENWVPLNPHGLMVYHYMFPIIEQQLLGYPLFSDRPKKRSDLSPFLTLCSFLLLLKHIPAPRLPWQDALGVHLKMGYTPRWYFKMFSREQIIIQWIWGFTMVYYFLTNPDLLQYRSTGQAKQRCPPPKKNYCLPLFTHTWVALKADVDPGQHLQSRGVSKAHFLLHGDLQLLQALLLVLENLMTSVYHFHHIVYNGGFTWFYHDLPIYISHKLHQVKRYEHPNEHIRFRTTSALTSMDVSWVTQLIERCDARAARLRTPSTLEALSESNLHLLGHNP